jgi:hypothetical protein
MRMNPQADENIERQYFNYVLNRIVPANAPADANPLSILADADFEWWWTIIQRSNGLLSLLISEAGSGRAFMNLPVNVDNLAGQVTAEGEFPLVVPYIMPRTRTYTFQFTDTSGAPNTVQVVLSGYKRFLPSGPPPAAPGAANA